MATVAATPLTVTVTGADSTRAIFPRNAADTRIRTGPGANSYSVGRAVNTRSPAVTSPFVPLSTLCPRVASTLPAASMRCSTTLSGITPSPLMTTVTSTGVATPTGTPDEGDATIDVSVC